jgi:hypothetical protein
MRVTNGIPLGVSLLLPVGTVNSVQTLKVAAHMSAIHRHGALPGIHRYVVVVAPAVKSVVRCSLGMMEENLSRCCCIACAASTFHTSVRVDKAQAIMSPGGGGGGGGGPRGGGGGGAARAPGEKNGLASPLPNFFS